MSRSARPDLFYIFFLLDKNRKDMDTITIEISEKDIASGRPLSENEHIKFNSSLLANFLSDVWLSTFKKQVLIS